MNYLITGCGRSGTGYMAKVFQEAGYDVGHEKMGQDGTSDWHAVGWPYPRLCMIAKRIVVFRHPLLCMRSLVGISEHSWKYIANHIPSIADETDPLRRAMRYWWIWNRWALPLADIVVNIQDPHHPGGLCEIKGIHDALDEVPKDYNTRGPYELVPEWEDLEKASTSMAKKIRETHAYMVYRTLGGGDIAPWEQDADLVPAPTPS